MKYRNEVEGEWIYPKRRGYRVMCCSCGLVHDLEFRTVKWGKRGNRIEIRIWSNKRATSQARRHNQKVKLRK